MVELSPRVPMVVRVHCVQFTSAPPSDADKGLLGWVRFTLNDIVRIDGVAVRRTLRGRLALAFPAKRDGTGRKRKFVRPVSTEVGREVEYQVLKALGFEEGSP